MSCPQTQTNSHDNSEKESFNCTPNQATQQSTQADQSLHTSTYADQLNYMLSHLDMIPDVCNEKIHVGLPLPENELNSLLMVIIVLLVNSSLICALFLRTNISHHQLYFADTGIISTGIHHIIISTFHAEHASRVLSRSFVDLSGRLHVPHVNTSIHRS